MGGSTDRADLREYDRGTIVRFTVRTRLFAIQVVCIASAS